MFILYFIIVEVIEAQHQPCHNQEQIGSSPKSDFPPAHDKELLQDHAW